MLGKQYLGEELCEEETPSPSLSFARMPAAETLSLSECRSRSLNWVLYADAEEELEEEYEEEEATAPAEKTAEGEEGDKGFSALLERLKEREKKEKAADLISKLRGKKKVNKKIMPYEIYATAGE